MSGLTADEWDALGKAFQAWCKRNKLEAAVLCTDKGSPLSAANMTIQHTVGLIRAAELVTEEEVRLLFRISYEEVQAARKERDNA